MSDDLINNLKTLSEEHERQARAIRERIQDIQDIPKAKALVGKCFKYKNNFGYKSRSWWSYKRVVASQRVHLAIDSFQQDARGEVEFKFGELDSAMYFAGRSWIEITEKEYYRAFDKLIRKIVEHNKKRGYNGKK